MSLGEYIGAGSNITKLLLHLNGNSNDSSGNGNNGTDTSISYGKQYGKFNDGASFNGSTSYIKILNSPSLNLTSNFTFSVWFKKNSSTTKQILIKWGRGSTLTRCQYHMWVNNNNKLSLFVRQSNGIDLEIADTSTIPVGVWTLVTFTGDSSSLKIYVNSLLKNAVAWSGYFNVPTTPNDLGVGVKIDDGYPADPAYFDGLMDEIIIENRAWTYQEVLKYYTNALGRFGII